MFLRFLAGCSSATCSSVFDLTVLWKMWVCKAIQTAKKKKRKLARIGPEIRMGHLQIVSYLDSCSRYTSTSTSSTGYSKWTICTIIAWVRDGASGDGRSATCIWFQCFRRAERCFLVSVSDCSECDSYAGDWPTVTGCPVSNSGNNCANGLFLWQPLLRPTASN